MFYRFFFGVLVSSARSAIVVVIYCVLVDKPSRDVPHLLVILITTGMFFDRPATTFMMKKIGRSDARFTRKKH